MTAVQPVRSLVDSSGRAFLVLSNGHRVRLPGVGGVSSTPDPPPVTDHGELAGLGDDDHPQYVRDTGDTVTGVLVSDIPGEYANGVSSVRIVRDTGPDILLHKQSQAAGQRKWRMYIAGEPFEAGPSPAALSFSALNDAEDAFDTVFRMQRNGRLTLGAAGVAPLDAVTVGQISRAEGVLSPASGWSDYGSSAAGMLVTRSGDGMVTVEASLTRATTQIITGGSPTQIATVPAGFWPTHDVNFDGGTFLSTGATAARFRITAAGVLQLIAFGTGSLTVAANGLTYVNTTYRGA